MKIECVKLVSEKHYLYDYLFNQKGLNVSTVGDCFGFSRQYSDINLMPRKNQSYSVKFKLKVFNINANDMISVIIVSIKYNSYSNYCQQEERFG